MKVLLSTSKGDVTLELDAEKAPDTVANFRGYAESGHYDGTLFHRVIKGFMIQGGGFDKDMRQKPTGDPIRNEADNGLKNEQGSIAMARTGDPHSATSQFFINTDDNAFLDFESETPKGWGYCVFGKVVDGMDTVYAIEEAITTSRSGHQDVPEEPIRIEKVAFV